MFDMHTYECYVALHVKQHSLNLFCACTGTYMWYVPVMADVSYRYSSLGTPTTEEGQVGWL